MNHFGICSNACYEVIRTRKGENVNFSIQNRDQRAEYPIYMLEHQLPGFKKLTSGVKILFHVELMQIQFFFHSRTLANKLERTVFVRLNVPLVQFISSYEIAITAIQTYSKKYSEYQWSYFTVLCLFIGYTSWKIGFQSTDKKNHEIQPTRQFDYNGRTNVCSIC